MSSKILLALCLGATSLACSSSDAGPGSGGIDAACGEIGTGLMTGTINGQPVTSTGAMSAYAFLQIGTPKKFDGSWGTGKVHLEWADLVADGQVAPLTAATVTVGSDPGSRTFQSGRFVYAKGEGETILKAALTFDTADVTVCIRKKESTGSP